MATRSSASGQFKSAATRPGIGSSKDAGRFKASQGKDAPRGRTSSGAPRAMANPPKK